MARCLTTITGGWCGEAAISITATYAHIGPEVSDPAKRYAGNNLACGDCHLEAGTKKFGLPVFGLYGDFPKYSARAGAEITIEDRVNACMTRSLNGRAMPADSPEMQAFVAYIKFLSTGVPPDQRLPGLGAGNIPELDRAADPVRGRAVYVAKCQGCHNTDGSGIRRSLPTTDLGYVVPPLMGCGLLQQRRRHEPSDHRGEFCPFQHAGGRGLFESGARDGRCVGRRGFRGLAAAAEQTGA